MKTIVQKFAAPILAGVVAVTILVSGASAQTAIPAPGCFVAPAKLADQQIIDFIANPARLLVDFESGGLPLSTRVRSLVGSSADTLEPILSLITPNLNQSQLAAIGAGLGRAVRACAPSNLEYATLIQTRIAMLNNDALDTAFMLGSAETQTASISGAGGGRGGAGGGGGASGIGNGGTAGGGSAGLDGSEFVVNQPGVFDVMRSRTFFPFLISP